MSASIPLGLRVIAIFKLVSACLLLAAGIGLFRLLDQDLGEAVEHCVHWLHLDPARPVMNDLISMVAGISQGKLRLIDAATFFYALLYFVEGVGLLRGAHWAEYLVVVATSALIPFEIIEAVHKLSAVRVGILAINLVIVIYLIRTVIRDRQRRLAATVV